MQPNLNYETTITRKFQNRLVENLPNICITVALIIRAIFVLVLAITFGYIFEELKEQGHTITALSIQYGIPIFLEVAFTVFSIISAALYGYGNKKWYFFLLASIVGLIYNFVQLVFLSDAIDFKNMDLKVQVTLQTANIVSWLLAEGAGMLVMSKTNGFATQIKQETISETTAETQNPVSDKETTVSEDEIEDTQGFECVGSITKIKPTYFIPKEFTTVSKTECIADKQLWNLTTAYKMYHTYKGRFDQNKGTVSENERKAYYLAYLIRHTEQGTSNVTNYMNEQKPDYPIPNIKDEKPLNGKKILNGFDGWKI